MPGMLPPLILELRAKAGQVYTELGKVDAAVEKTAAESEAGMGRAEKAFGKLAGAGKILGAGVAIGGAIVAVETTRMAANFQQASLRLVTDAGESYKNLGMVKSGMLQLSAQTGMSASEIAKGMYYVESAGYHGAAGLNVMKAAAEGAKIGGADVTTVADALTTAMTDYGPKIGNAAQVTSKLIATVGQGKTTMEALAGSLHSVLPNAQSLGISFPQVAGAMATMTAEGISADQASQNLNHAIVSLSNPTSVMTKEMAAMGLNSTTVAAQLGKKGLTGTLGELVTSITSHMGPAGLVLQSAFTHSQLAAQSAQAEYKHLGSGAQQLATEYMKGSITLKQWTTDTKAMSPVQANLAHQWAASYMGSQSFNASLRANQGAAQTFTGALAKMTGGQTGLSVALHLTGDHMATFRNNVAIVGKASSDAQGNVKGWKETQTNLNQQLDEAKATVAALGIKIGTALLPGMTSALHASMGLLSYLEGHHTVLTVVAGLIGGVMAVAIGAYIAHLAVAAVNSIRDFAKMAAAGAEWAAEQAVQFAQVVAKLATMVAAGAAQMAAWVAQQVAAVADSVPVWLQWQAMQAEAAAKSAATWVAQQAAFVAGQAAAMGRWVAVQAVGFAQGAAKAAVYAATSVVSAARSTAAWLASSAKTVVALGVQGAALVAQKVPMLASAAATGIVTAAQWAWNVAMDANPIGIVILAIGALIAAVILVATHWKQVTSFLTAAWADVSSVFQSVGAALASWWSGFWGGIVGRVKDIFGGYVTVISSIFNLVVGLFTGNSARISSAWTGLWNGLKSIATGLFGSAGTWLVDAGENIVNGLINGVKSMVGGAVKAVSGMASSVISAAKGVLGIHSPSTVFAEMGGYIGQGLIDGVNGRTSDVQSAGVRMATAIQNAFNAKKGGISATQAANLTDIVRIDNGKLASLAADRANIGTRLSAATKSLTADLKAESTYAASVKSSLLGVVDAGKAGDSTNLIAQLQNQVSQTKQLGTDLAKLSKMGLDKTTYAQLVAGGTADLATDNALASSTPAQVKQIAALQNQLVSQATSVSNTAASGMYGAGVNAAKGLVKGLQSQEKTLDSQMERLASVMVSSIKKQLGIHSPSVVFHGFGVNITEGLVNGLAEGTPRVKSAVTGLVTVPASGQAALSASLLAGSGRAPVPAGGQRASGSGAPAPASSSKTNQVNVYAQTNATPSQIASSVGWELRRMS